MNITTASRKAWNKSKITFSKYFRRSRIWLRQNPNRVMIAFFVVMAVLLIAGRWLNKPEPPTEPAQDEPRLVETYSIGAAPRITVQARVQKGNVINIVAQTPGIVQKINVKEGQSVKRGQNLISLSSNYQGGNAATVQRQIAQVQQQHTADTYDQQKSLLDQQREVALQTSDNAEELRQITDRSLGETRDLIDLNEDILSEIEDNLEDLEENNPNNQNDPLILQTKQLQSQYKAGLNQLRSGLRQAEYQADDEEPPAELAQLQKDLTLQQLDIQAKSLDMSREMANLQLRLAKVNEGSMYPGAPLGGQVERIHVQIGQQVNPGTKLVTLQSSGQATTVVALVPRQIALSLSKIELTRLNLGDKTIELAPTYVSHEAVENGLYSIVFNLPETENVSVSDNQVVAIDLPVGLADTSDIIPFIPLDAVYQNGRQAFVFTAQEEKARVQPVKLGSVFGSFVQISDGLKKEDQVILDRNVIDGDPITIVNQGLLTE